MEAKVCPNCGGTQWIPIAYGKPGAEACARCYARANSPTLYVLTGLPGSGKSTHARALAASTGAVHVAMDDAVVAAGLSLVDYEARFALQPAVEAKISPLLASGESVVAEFGSWARAERDHLRELVSGTSSRTELHFVDAPLELCRERVLARGGIGSEQLAGEILESSREFYERPTAEEGANYDSFVVVNGD